MFYKRFGKRTFDVAFAAAALLVFSIPLSIISILVRIFLGSPVLFLQKRPGLAGKPFTICKFRTMTERTDSDGVLLPDAQRLNWFGKTLRATSLDELPELLNVLKGEMSLVGPRPLLMEYLPLYTPHQARRHLVRPGITGLAQVSGRNAISWEDKFELDVRYVEEHSLALDLKIIFLTFYKILKSEGIAAEGCATMTIFRGGKENEEPARGK